MVQSYGEKSIAVLPFLDLSPDGDLEGSVRKAGDRLRITVQLIEARSDTHLWSESYDRPAGNIFAIQDEIAANVVAKLKLTLLSEVPTVQKPKPEAHNLLLQARHKLRTRGMPQLTQIIELAKRALDIDPNYVQAWVFLADMYQREGLMEAYAKK